MRRCGTSLRSGMLRIRSRAAGTGRLPVDRAQGAIKRQSRQSSACGHAVAGRRALVARPPAVTRCGGRAGSGRAGDPHGASAARPTSPRRFDAPPALGPSSPGRRFHGLRALLDPPAFGHGPAPASVRVPHVRPCPIASLCPRTPFRDGREHQREQQREQRHQARGCQRVVAALGRLRDVRARLIPRTGHGRRVGSGHRQDRDSRHASLRDAADSAVAACSSRWGRLGGGRLRRRGLIRGRGRLRRRGLIRGRGRPRRRGARARDRRARDTREQAPPRARHGALDPPRGRGWVGPGWRAFAPSRGSIRNRPLKLDARPRRARCRGCRSGDRRTLVPAPAKR